MMSVRFKSSESGKKGTGFRLLYSFHAPHDRPKQRRNGRWVCSGARGFIMVQHFLCQFETFCDHGEDNAGGCPPAWLCGDSSVRIDGRCYRYMKPIRKIKWREALNYCMANNGNLASLNTEKEWKGVAKFWTDTASMDHYLIVGLKHFNSFHSQNMYSSLWQWTDQSIAYYLNISVSPDSILSPPYCAAFQAHEAHLTVISCDSPLKANYLCEMGNPGSRSELKREIQLQFPSRLVSNYPHMSECPNQDITYTFFLCDSVSRCYGGDGARMQKCLSENYFLTETMFTCRNEKMRVHYTSMCDHRLDCYDASDESFCFFPPCPEASFECWDSQECISRHFVCDGTDHCRDGSDEKMCNEQEVVSESLTVTAPAVVNFLPGRGSVTLTPSSFLLATSACPETHFLCPSSHYCLPVFVRCNHVWDCPEGEDEMDCSSYLCPGFYRCYRSQICIHADHLCDGEFQCPEHDDELMCNRTCPVECSCIGFAFICFHQFSAYLYPELRYLSAPSTNMTIQDVANNTQLIYLSLKNCGIKQIGMAKLPNLLTLDLSYNSITSLSDFELRDLINLRSLSLAFNKLFSLNVVDFVDIVMPSLEFLDISGGSIHEISNITFLQFPNIEYLNLSGTKLQKVSISGFDTLQNLRVLDLSRCALTEYSKGMLKELPNLEKLYASSFHMCCPTIVSEGFSPENCYGPSNEVSSCAALLKLDIFRVFLVIYAVLALAGNFASFIYRIFGKGVITKFCFDIFVTHLCVSDFLMGVYLAIIGIADRVYYGNYDWDDRQWRQSVVCQLAGFLSFLSSEVSAFLIFYITLERLLLTLFPHSNVCFTPKSAQAACMIGWVVGILLAAVPLLPFSPPWELYSQTGICVPLSITRKAFPGSDYSFSVMIVFNFVLFLFIAAGQVLIFWPLYFRKKIISNCNKKTKDVAIARRLLAVVMTDFLCWFPIGLLGMLTRRGVAIPGNINVALAIFLLPLNSALNPFLYNFHQIIESRLFARALLRSTTKDETTSGSCPTCTARGEGLSPNIPSSTEGIVDSSDIDEDETIDQEMFNLIQDFLEENDMSPELFQFHITQIIKESHSPVIDNTLQI